MNRQLHAQIRHIAGIVLKSDPFKLYAQFVNPSFVYQIDYSDALIAKFSPLQTEPPAVACAIETIFINYFNYILFSDFLKYIFQSFQKQRISFIIICFIICYFSTNRRVNTRVFYSRAKDYDINTIVKELDSARVEFCMQFRKKFTY